MFRAYRGWLPHRKSKFSKEQKEEFAAKQRANPTFTERIMWEYLRDDQCGATFERQVVTSCGWIADFLCESRKLIIEIDGAKHETEKDSVRDLAHHKKGYSTLRITTEEAETESPRAIMVRVRMLVTDRSNAGRVTHRLTSMVKDTAEPERLTFSQLLTICRKYRCAADGTPKQDERAEVMRVRLHEGGSMGGGNNAKPRPPLLPPQHSPDPPTYQMTLLKSLYKESPRMASMIRESSMETRRGQNEMSVWFMFVGRMSFHYHKLIQYSADKEGPLLYQLLSEQWGIGVSVFADLDCIEQVKLFGSVMK